MHFFIDLAHAKNENLKPEETETRKWKTSEWVHKPA